MFSVENKSEKGFDKIILADSTSGAIVEILPSCGAMLQSFSLPVNGQRQEFIIGYDNAADYQENQSSKGFRSAKLSPFACRVKNGTYQHAGQNFRFQKFYLDQHALHGLLYDAVFEVQSTRSGANGAAVTMLAKYQGEDQGFPFSYNCHVEYILEANSSLHIITSIKNTSDKIIPMADGWHPYFTFNKNIDDLLLEFQTETKLTFDEELIPTGEEEAYEEFVSLKKIENTSFDDCFRLNFDTCQPMLVLKDPAQNIQIEMRPGKEYPFLQLYSPPDRQSIALENLSAAPNCFNNKIGLMQLQPNEEKIFSTNFKIVVTS